LKTPASSQRFCQRGSIDFGSYRSFMEGMEARDITAGR